MSDISTVVLFADLTGSVKLYESLGDVAAKGIVVGLQEQLESEVVACKGIVHEIIGDEIMCCFEQAENAIDCAAKIHQRAEDYCTQLCSGQTDNPTLPDNIEMRIGIHAGSAIRDGDRLFGDTVNTAARIMSIAQAGQTIATQAVLQQLAPQQQAQAREFDTANLKGKSEPMVVYDFPWQVHGLTRIQQVVVDSAPTTLQLTYASKTFDISIKDSPATLGRAVNNLVVVDCEPVSRRHVSIEFLRGRFVLSDKSTNGTHVYPEKGEGIYLRREQLPLWGNGRFSMGAPQEEMPEHMVEYCCETSNQNKDNKMATVSKSLET